MKIEPGLNIHERQNYALITSSTQAPSKEAAESFEKSDSADGNQVRKDGLRAMILDRNATSRLEKSVIDDIVRPIKLPDPDLGYYQGDCIARNTSGTTAALVIKGHQMDSPRDLVILDPSMNVKNQVSTEACNLYGAPDGTFVLLGRKGYSDPTLVTSHSADGTKQWSVNLSEKGLSPFIESVQLTASGEVLIVHNSSQASIVKDGQLTRIDSKGRGHSLHFDEIGRCYDCDLYTTKPSYTIHDSSGQTRKKLLPQVPGVTADDYSGIGDSPKRLDDHHILTDGSVIVTATSLKDELPSTYLLKPGATKAVELKAKDYTIVRESLQGMDGTIYSVGLRLGGAATSGGEPPAERVLVAFNNDGSEKWQASLPATESGAGRERVFMDSRNHVLVFTNFLYDKGQGSSQRACCLEAFDPDGTSLWTKNFDSPMDLHRADAHQDGSLDLFFDSSRDGIFHINPFDRKSIEAQKDKVINDMAAKKEESGSDSQGASGVTVDSEQNVVIIDGIKLPINRRFSWIH